MEELREAVPGDHRYRAEHNYIFHLASNHTLILAFVFRYKCLSKEGGVLDFVGKEVRERKVNRKKDKVN